MQMRMRTQEIRVVFVKNPAAEATGTIGGGATRPAQQPALLGRARGGRG